MIKKRRWRYYCEYCKKSGGNAGAMATHEKHCTMNPNRECRLCIRMEEIQFPVNELIAMLPKEKSYKIETEISGIYNYPNLKEDAINAIEKLRDKTENCPMCIFSALRQSGILTTGLVEFNLKEELETFWDDIREREYEADQGMY